MSGSYQGPGTGRVGIVENWELRQSHKQDANSGAFKGLLFVVVALLLIVVGGWFAARPILGPILTNAFEDAPSLVDVPIVSDILAAEFADRVDSPAGASDTPVKFVIEDKQTLADIASNLVSVGLLTDVPAFNYAIQRDRIDQLIKPGTYTMTPRITPGGIAARLAGDPDPPTPTITLDMRPQRRLEQTVAYLEQEVEQAGLTLDPSEFLRIARNPSQKLRNQYRFLKEIPAGSSLEGFLYPATYSVPIDISADALVHMMLDKWQSRVGQTVAQASKAGRDFYDVMKVASLVEREAQDDSDRAKIAGVFWNRLDPKVNGPTGGLLQSDPTVIYATDSMALADMDIKDWDQYVFWDLLGVPDYSTVQVDKKYASYQTYQQAGLPATPIASPTLKSIEAALNPVTKSKLLYFYSCPGSTKHSFAKTFKQHQRHIDQCQ